MIRIQCNWKFLKNPLLHFSIRWTKPHPKKLRTEVNTHGKLGKLHLLFSSCDTTSNAPHSIELQSRGLPVHHTSTDWHVSYAPGPSESTLAAVPLWPLLPVVQFFFKFLLFLCLFSILSVGWKVFPLSHCSVLFSEPWTNQYTMLVPGKSSLKAAYFYNWTYSYEMHFVPHYA